MVRLLASSQRPFSGRPAVARIGTRSPCSGSLPVRSARSGISSWTIRCIREREAHRRAPSKLCKQRPGFERVRAFLSFNAQHASRPAAVVQRSTGSHTGNGERSFKTCREAQATTGWSCFAKHADVAQQAERDHAMVEATRSRLVIRSTIHFGCVLALRSALAWCWRSGCARPELGPRAARHLIRQDARAWAQPK